MQPKNKEVVVDGMDTPQYLDVFTIPEAATYLGKTQLTLKKWITDRMIPPPILVCTTYGYRHYSIGEMKLVASVLREHYREYEYLHTTHEVTINRLWQSLEGYRKSHM